MPWRSSCISDRRAAFAPPSLPPSLPRPQRVQRLASFPLGHFEVEDDDDAVATRKTDSMVGV